MKQNSELGIRNAQWEPIPNPAFRIPHFLAAAACLFVLCMFPAAAGACPGCKEALFDPKQVQQKQSAAQGYNLSIGLLLAVPATLVGGTSAMLIRAGRRKRREAGVH